ncbi:MAG: glycosyltransferase [Thermomicrobiales bacterium]
MATPSRALDQNTPNEDAPAWFAPLQVLDIDLAQPMRALLPATDTQGNEYRKGMVLIRDGGRPIATVEIDIPPGGLSAEALDEALRARVSTTGSDSQRRSDAAARREFLGRAPFASVIIATRNRPDRLARCLASVEALDYPHFDVIVVDNNPSDDATAEFFAERYGADPRFHYVREYRPGLAAAHNRGVQEMAAGSEFAAFTDDDVLVDRFWLCELIRGFDAAPNVGCVTGMIFPLELETWPQLLIEEFGGFNKGFQRQVYDQGKHRPPDPLFPFTPGRFGSGANMAFRRSSLARVGGFDPAMGTGTPAMGGDDLAAFFRVIASGEALVYEPAAIVRHAHYREYTALQRQIYGYGVGLTAFLTKALLDQPRLLLVLAAKAPRGLVYALSPRSGKNRKKGTDYPAELTRLERKGMVQGPLAALRSVRAARAYEREASIASGRAATS